ncbi:MAG: hypothetical protein WBJ10_12095 [Daejeonella sp.]|uniref:hypothetical protein n=1 Tax=Daejeonella sp. TaxID=2805397 RepID=UPI003C77B602
MNIKTIITLAILTACLSCNSTTKQKSDIKTNDSLQPTTSKIAYDRTENLLISIPDKIKKSAAFYFSNSQTKDLFLLTIEPGMVRNSKSFLQIITTDNKVIYTQSFDTYYFIKSVYEPDTIPATGGQDAYDRYIENYWKSITPKQYELEFKKNVDSFFEAIYPIPKSEYANLKNWDENITDHEFLQEVAADTTVHLIDIICFDCDEGGAMIGFSKQRNKVVTLVEHD